MRTLLIGLGIAALGGCGPTPNGNHGGDDDGPGDASTNGGDDGTPLPDASCGAQMAMIGVVNLGDPPDLLVVLDRSGSMSAPPTSFPPQFTPKWTIMRNGLTSVVTSKQTAIKFGLLEFPSDDNCAADANPEVGIALNAAGSFNSYFASRSPNGNTPAHIALGSALTYYNTLPVNPAGRYVLFATDGLPNCGGAAQDQGSDAETVAAVTALRNVGIKTFVLGFGTFGLPAGVLNDAAVAGGVPKAGANKFYEANNAAELDAALQAIAGGLVVPSCSFQLASAPPDPNNVTVTINGTPVPRSPSHTDGWDYHPNPMTITFFGSYCQTIKMGAQTNVSFVYGCPGPIVE
ncbi:MAG: VWA domain-containing protein [Deltaproteobacteria bacterium]|nr:VWA domain-containing protein [Deltaproteobacteria bacterium]MCW5807793.1 VWA domain-containing protein [Deltaproteobacteria bacterium]